MGYIVDVKCEKCGELKSFHLGNGIKDFNCDVVAEHFSDKSIIDTIYDNKGNWNFNWKLAWCKQCKNVFRVPTLLNFKDDVSKELVEAKCKCGCNDIAIIDEESDKLSKCNKCGQAYVIEKKGLWD